jgi:hypothetical protein
MGSACAIIYTELMGVRLNKSLKTSSRIGPRGIRDPCGWIIGTLYATVVYGGSKFTNSFAQLGPAEPRTDARCAGVVRLVTITPV